MRITFTFSEINVPQTPGLNRSSATSLEIPDESGELPDFKDRINELAAAISKLTEDSLLLSCRALGMKEHPIRVRPEETRGHFQFRETVIVFNRYDARYNVTRKHLRIIDPIDAPIHVPYPAERKKNARTLPRMLIHQQSMIARNPEQEAYYQLIQIVIDQMLALLNSGTEKGWTFEGFHPHWLNKAAVTQSNKRLRARIAQEHRKEKQAQKLAEKLKKKVEQGIALEPATEPRTGAGRVPGARPGIYKGVQMRSQLEIRFAAELDERGIRWIYEGEAVSTASYLVDFYLPDLGVWVEVKGRFEARDKQVLPEVARYLKTERSHRLLVYTGSGACMVVNPSGFREVERKNFWGEVIR